MSLTPIDPGAVLGQAVDRFRLTEALETSSGLLYVAELSEPRSRGHGQHTKFVVRLLGRFRARAGDRRAWVDELHTLAHPALVPYVETGMAQGGLFNGAYYFARQRLTRSRPRELDRDRVLRAAQSLYSGIAFLHSREVIHGALKPSNIHFSSTGGWRMLDFGLVQLQELEGALPERFDYRFAAPELRDGVFSPPADVYSVAALLVYMATPPEMELGPLAALEWLHEHWDRSRESDEMLAVLRASLILDPAGRPVAQAISDFFASEGEPRAHLLEPLKAAISDPEFFRHAYARATGLTRRFGYREDPQDLLQDALVRILAAAETKPALAAQLSSEGALSRYFNVVLRNTAIDRMRSGQRREHLVLGQESEIGEALVASREVDPAGRMEDLDQIEGIIGRVAAAAVRLRSRGLSYEDIAEYLNRIDTRRRGAWTSRQVFMLLYRTRRAYPELEQELPPDEPANDQQYFADWLSELGMADAADRALVAGRLAGVSLPDIATATGLSESALRRRFTRLSHDDPWIVMLFEPRPLPRQFDEAAAQLASWVTPPKVRLEQPWLDELRSRTAWLLEREGRRALNDERARDEVVASMLGQLELASHVREAVLDEPAYSLDDIAKMLEISDDAAEAWVSEHCSRGELIALSVLDRGIVVPAFQFDGDQLRDIVRRVNVSLHPEVDPWGAAGWWIQGNARLPGAASPASFIEVDPDAVRQVAESLAE